MDVAAGLRLLGLLALAAAVAVVTVVVLALAAAAGSSRARESLDAVRDLVAGRGASLATVVAAVSTAGSLWLSEGAGFPPCRLCWWQRAAMYPLVPLLAAATGSARLRRAGVVVALVGAAVSTWHVLVERYPDLDAAVSCDPTNPCSIRWVEEFGFLTIPMMAWLGFALVASLLLLDGRRGPGPGHDEDARTPTTTPRTEEHA